MQISSGNLINTLLQQGVVRGTTAENCFNSFLSGGKTAEAVAPPACALPTPLKWGVNEIDITRSFHECELADSCLRS
jgi:hypothetical protein